MYRLTHGFWGITGYIRGGQLYNTLGPLALGCYKLTIAGIPIMPKEPRVNLHICSSGKEKDPAGAYSMCTNPCCLGMYWCSQWGYCKPPELEMDDSDFEEPPAKKTMSRFATPVSPSKMDTICQGYVPPNAKKAISWAERAFEKWRDQRNKKSKFAARCDLLSFSISHILENICIPQNILENMNTTQDVLSGTGYNVYSFALMFGPPGLQI